MAMILPFTTSLPPESPYPGPEALPRQEMKTEESDARDAVRDRKDKEKDVESSPDDDDFATIMGLLLGGSQVTSAANESAKTQASGTTLEDTAASDAVKSADAAAADSSKGTVDLLAQSKLAAASLAGEKNAQEVASEQAAATLVKQTQLATAGESSMAKTEELIAASEQTSATKSLVQAVEQTNTVGQKPSELSKAATPVAANVVPADDETQASLEFQELALPNAEAVDSFEPAVAPDNFSAQTTFASVSEQLQSANFQPDLRIQNRLQETRDIRTEPSSSATIKSAAGTRSSGVSQSLPSAVPGGDTAVAAATVNGNAQLTASAMLPADPLLDVFSVTGVNETPDMASRIERTMKAAEVSAQPVTSNAIQGSLQQFWSDHSAGGGSRERSSSNSAEAELAAIGGTQSASDVSRNLSSGGAAITSQLVSSDLAMTATAELRQPLSAQVSQAVLEHLQNQSAQKNEALTVRLDPPELGEMVIEISRSTDGLAVRVTAREPITMDMLLARGREIEVQLRGENLDLSSLEFLSPGMSGGTSSHDSSSRDTSAFTDGNGNSSRRAGRGGSAGALTSTPVPARVISNGPLSFRA